MSAGHEKSGAENTIKYGPLFSFFDYYQDFIHDLGYFADPEGKSHQYSHYLTLDSEEMDLLREQMVIDPHIDWNHSSRNFDSNLFGYSLLPCRPQEEYSPDYIINH